MHKTISHCKTTTFLTAVLITLSVGIALFPPLVLERIVNQLSAQRTVPLLLPLTYFGLLALSGLLESGQNVMITVFAFQLILRLDKEAVAAIPKADIQLTVIYFDFPLLQPLAPAV